MNERIKELIEQCTVEEHDGFRFFDKAKFAELIVKECATILRETDFSFDLKSEHDKANTGAELGATMIEEYFGVK
jgi:hypothetical protein